MYKKRRNKRLVRELNLLIFFLFGFSFDKIVYWLGWEGILRSFVFGWGIK